MFKKVAVTLSIGVFAFGIGGCEQHYDIVTSALTSAGQSGGGLTPGAQPSPGVPLIVTPVPGGNPGPSKDGGDGSENPGGGETSGGGGTPSGGSKGGGSENSGGGSMSGGGGGGETSGSGGTPSGGSKGGGSENSGGGSGSEGSVSGRIILNVSFVEILKQGPQDNAENPVSFDKNLGRIDLFVLAPKIFDDANLPAGSDVHEARIHVFPIGNEVDDAQGKLICQLKVPSSALKLKMDHFVVQSGESYSIEINSNEVDYHPADKSCILRPEAQVDVVASP